MEKHFRLAHETVRSRGESVKTNIEWIDSFRLILFQFQHIKMIDCNYNWTTFENYIVLQEYAE